METRPKLYSGTKNASSWAMRAWLALKEAGVPFEEEVVDIRRPQRFANLTAIGRFSPPAMVPVLVHGDIVVFDSLAIMEYANDLGGGKLLPGSIEQRAQARSILAWQHSGLSNICPRISFESAFYPLKRKLSSHEQDEADRLLAALENSLSRSGGPYLFGALSLADLALVPTVLRLSRHEVGLLAARRVASWIMAVLELDSVREWVNEADGLPPIWDDDYLIPGSAIELHPSVAVAGPH
jgi:glutathione S-transferase